MFQTTFPQAIRALLLISLGGFSLACQWVGDDVKREAPARTPKVDNATILGAPFQPPAEHREKIGVAVSADDPGVEVRGGFVLRDGVPYFSYRYLNEGAGFAFHPLMMGNYLADAGPEAVTAAVSVSTMLPNGGRVWYYPPLYRNSRMQGPYWRYSAMSQGAVLSGLTSQILAGNRQAAVVAKEVIRGLEFPFEEGGVSLDGRVSLEMPSYLSAPETILNGWLDVLLHLHDYAKATSDPAAQKLLARHLAYLAEVLPQFDSPEEQLSRYSDLSPYLATLAFAETVTQPALYAIYQPQAEGRNTLVVPIRRLQQDTRSVYDNQVVTARGNVFTVTLSVSQAYDTTVWADHPFTLAVEQGTIELQQSTPGRGGLTHKLSSGPGQGGHEIQLDHARLGLIAGYPTNFSRQGKYNYYHVYHVVALMLLGRYVAVDDDVRNKLLAHAIRWRSYLAQKKLPAELQFYDPETMLRHIQRSRALPEAIDFAALEAWGNRKQN
jgi:hypothetical protein